MVLAPLYLFLAEHMWRQLTDAPRNGIVHLAAWPTHDPANHDSNLEEEMALARRLVPAAPLAPGRSQSPPTHPPGCRRPTPNRPRLLATSSPRNSTSTRSPSPTPSERSCPSSWSPTSGSSVATWAQPSKTRPRTGHHRQPSRRRRPRVGRNRPSRTVNWTGPPRSRRHRDPGQSQSSSRRYAKAPKPSPVAPSLSDSRQVD
jgi:hypothetical protein